MTTDDVSQFDDIWRPIDEISQFDDIWMPTDDNGHFDDMWMIIDELSQFDGMPIDDIGDFDDSTLRVQPHNRWAAAEATALGSAVSGQVHIQSSNKTNRLTDKNHLSSNKTNKQKSLWQPAWHSASQ